MSKSRHRLNDLHTLARLHGVQTTYLDMNQRRQQASPEALLAVLRTLRVPVERGNDVPEALREARRALVHRVLEPVHVAWLGQRTVIALQLPDWASAGPLRLEWSLEQGAVCSQETRWERLPVKRIRRVERQEFVTRMVPAPKGLPAGYHRLTVECGHDRFETLVFCAPERCFQASTRARTWGVFAPLYALHSDKSRGAGSFADLAELVSWIGQQGGRFVGTLPLLPAFLQKPHEPSPYSPVSRLFWNEFYLDLDQIPELASCTAARRLMESSAWQARQRKLRKAPLVNYSAQLALQREVLEFLSRSLFARPSKRRDAYQRFLHTHPQVVDYARFRAVHEQHGQPWAHWPERMRCGELRETDCRPSVRQYHLYIQWLAHEQMARVSDHARRQGVDLYLDMPLGVHRDGYDTWRYQDLFALEASGGAPPDPVFTHGQDWGFAPIHPERSREEGHAYIRNYLRHHLHHARMLRLDHVMGLHRLYWVPSGLPATQGAYVTYPAEEFYAMLSIESHRHQAAIIGENLGTVPAEVERSLERHGVGGMFVVQYEVQPGPRVSLRPVRPGEAASVNTHDMPPFAAYWEGLDIPDRRELGLIKPQNLARDYRLRDRVRKALLQYLWRRRLLSRQTADAGKVFQALVKHLGASPARWVLLNLEDLWLETAPQNTPGTSTERVNWRRKARLCLDLFRERSDVLSILDELRRARR